MASFLNSISTSPRIVRLSPETGILMSIFLQRDLAKVLEILMSGLTTSTSKRKTPTLGWHKLVVAVIPYLVFV